MFLGIEIGGTKLQLGCGTGDGRLLAAVNRLEVNPADGAKGVREQIVEAFYCGLDHSTFDPPTPLAIGVGFGGPFDSRTGRTIK